MAKKILTKEKRLKLVRKVNEKELVYLHSLDLTDRQIAKKFNCSPSTIYRWRAKLGLIANHLSWSGERKNLNELTKAFEDYKKTCLKNEKDRRKSNLQIERDKDRVYAEKRRKDNRSNSMLKENNRKCYIKNYASNGKCNFCGRKITIFSNICLSCLAKKRIRDNKGIFVSMTDGRKTSPNGDFSNEKEHNISLKELSEDNSQISSNDETSLNNNIHRLRPNFEIGSLVRRNL